jgi:hypothetical protein
MEGSGRSSTAVAGVTYEAPQGSEALELFEGDVVSFGRGSECAIRFGYAPQPDQEVPRVAGQFVVLNQRVFIQSADKLGHRALEIESKNQSVQVPLGEGYSSRESRFDVVVRGLNKSWRLRVTTRAPQIVQGLEDGDDPPTTNFTLDLTEFQWRVLRAYAEPIRMGRIEPATHKEVATELSYHPNTVRETLYGIWLIFFEQGVPMLDVDDKRVAVVEASRVHGHLR